MYTHIDKEEQGSLIFIEENKTKNIQKSKSKKKKHLKTRKV